MRIISGSLGGRQFDSPKSHRTHPMSDKVRGGLFNILGDIAGLTVLDCFAGSGALSFEAVSRGAVSATAVEVDITSHRCISENIKTLGLKGLVKPIRANISSWSKNNPTSVFGIVICDPPYDKINLDVLINMAVHVAIGDLIVYSLSPKTDVELPDNQFLLLSTRLYGDSKLVFYRRIS
ncbi:MAG TPA: RsmD family RNA methyltransferase [Candidatus Saccharimonadales bacterium]|nr:RsmD family RNA methyltransferase [Candidatus Saccharimonadales bacterium]